MAYCTEAQIRLVYNTNRVTDAVDDDASGTADTGVIAAVIEDVDATIESYVCRQYASLTASYTGTMPKVLQHMAEKLCVARLLARQGQHHRWEEDVMTWLKDIAEGDAVIPGFDSGNLPDSTTRLVCKEFSPKALDDLGEPYPDQMSTGDENDNGSATSEDD